MKRYKNFTFTGKFKLISYKSIYKTNLMRRKICHLNVKVLNYYCIYNLYNSKCNTFKNSKIINKFMKFRSAMYVAVQRYIKFIYDKK